MRQKLASIAQTLRLPALCVLCNQFHKNHLAVCSDCVRFITPIGPCCQYCAHPLSENKSNPICGKCIKKKPHFDKAYIAYQFEEPLRELLHQFKYHNGLHLKSFLAHLMLHALKETTPNQCLIPVPMHAHKLKQRGFNQAALLTQYLAKKLKLPYDLGSCKKIINTAPQASLNGEQRKNNLKNAFTIKPIPYENVILIDDLLTTGNTANELALTLKKSGIKQVSLCCCARTVYE